jgi:hypothetical protein
LVTSKESRTPRVVDQDVHAALGFDCVAQRDHLLVIGDVTHHPGYRRMRRRRLPQRCLRSTGDDHGGSLIGEGAGHGQADTRTAAGDHYALPVESHPRPVLN